MMEIELNLLDHQHNFISDVDTRYVGFIGGYGCGKTFAFCAKSIYLAWLNAGFNGCMLEPTHAMASDVLIPQFRELLDELQLPYDYKATPYPTFSLHFDDGTSTVLIRSAENYKKLVGLNLAWFGVDEADTIEKKTALAMWRVLESRLRAQAPYIQGFTTSTPEGFSFLYDFFIKQPANDPKIQNRKIYRARTADNPFLDEDFIPSLLQNYPPNLIEAYLEGKFVNLTNGSVYYAFDRTLNESPYNVSTMDRPNYLAPLHIGMDFNVGKCCAIVHIIDDEGNPHAVDEITKGINTEDMIDKIKSKFPKRDITIYPDASGGSRKTNASTTDLQLLRQAGFHVVVDGSNPAVRDRINAMNAMFCNADKKRRYFVSPRCQSYITALETQGYNSNGEPDKQHDQDHPVDAAGYMIYKLFPLRNNTGKVIRLQGT